MQISKTFILTIKINQIVEDLWALKYYNTFPKKDGSNTEIVIVNQFH